MSLTILTWLWEQPSCRTSFTATHVNIWAAMIRRHCRLEIDLACVTDMPEGIDPSIRIIKPPGFHDDLHTSRWKAGRPSCYRRLAMFRRDAAAIFGKRFLCMDLDVVIGARIDRIINRDEDFVICAPSSVGKRWRYNGSMMLITAGCRPQVYEDFTPERAEEASAQFVGSDQAWLGYILGPGEATWGAREGVTRWPNKDGRMMFFPGSVKPWDALGDPWVSEHYRLGARSRGLILGRNGRVWDDARAALGRGIKGPVIALESSAAQWPGRVDAVARDMPHAHALARMLGIERPIVCGGG